MVNNLYWRIHWLKIFPFIQKLKVISNSIQKLIFRFILTENNPKSLHINIDHFLKGISGDFRDLKIDNEHLIGKWQDSVLANAIVTNYLNSLTVLASRQDFPLTVPDGYSVKYIQNPSSFQQTSSQLATEMRKALTDAREDLNRVHIGMGPVPDDLKEIVILLKQAPYDLLLILFPNSFNKIEKLVNDSLIVLRKPKQNFEQVLNLLIEIDYLLSFTSTTDHIISLQVNDIKDQWTYLTELINELARLAETAHESFLLQFNWILQTLTSPGFPFVDDHRDFILLFLMSKIIELDQTSDLLSLVTETYTDQQISSYGHLILLTDEKIRKQF